MHDHHGPNDDVRLWEIFNKNDIFNIFSQTFWGQDLFLELFADNSFVHEEQ